MLNGYTDIDYSFGVLGLQQELQLHLGVLQQHAALIGGPNAQTCPMCHKLFFGTDALMEHIKHSHKDSNLTGVQSESKRKQLN